MTGIVGDAVFSAAFSQIPVLADLPVGLNYHDHPTMPVNVFFGRPERVDLLQTSEMTNRLSHLQHRFLGEGEIRHHPTCV